MSPFFQELEAADKGISLAINVFGGGALDSFMALVSGRLTWAPLYVLLLALLVYRLGWKKALLTLVIAVIALAACDQLANLVKNWAQRLRPCRDAYMLENGLRVLENKGGRYGFYSAHAATLTGISVVIMRALRGDSVRKWLGWLLAFWVLLVGISRIFVGKHFLGDVIVGIIAGFLTSLIVCKCAELLVRHCRKSDK